MERDFNLDEMVRAYKIWELSQRHNEGTMEFRELLYNDYCKLRDKYYSFQKTYDDSSFASA